MKRFDIALTIGLAVSILLSSFTSFARDCEDVRKGSLRLHILANSDSNADQDLKLKVRDKILERSYDLFLPAYSKEQVKASVGTELTRIEQIAREEIARQGYDYPVKAELVNMFFDTRAYGEAVLPAGRYDAVRVSIGEAGGKNWWCVLFPPLCIPAAGEKTPVEEQIEHLGEEPRYVPKLAVLEFLEKISNKKTETDGRR